MLNRYFLFSGGLHILAAVILIFAAQFAWNKKPQAVYTIDFLGSNFQTPVSGIETPQPAAQTRPAPEVKEPEVSTPPAPNPKAYAAAQTMTVKPVKAAPKKIVLGAPSILKTNAEKPASSAPAASSGSGGGIGIKTDMPDFPYPWYITQVKNALWDQWQKRKPLRVVLNALISFAIKPDGSIRDVKITKSSGNDGYDYAARSSVEGAAPFPPLPKDFGKPELTVTVEFKDEGN